MKDPIVIAVNEFPKTNQTCYYASWIYLEKVKFGVSYQKSIDKDLLARLRGDVRLYFSSITSLDGSKGREAFHTAR
jgi:hypothetical protein